MTIVTPAYLNGSPIDLMTVRVIVFSYPDGAWNPQLRKWIRGRFWRCTEHPDDQIIDVIEPDLDILCARNFAIKEHVIDKPGKYNHFLFIERDVRPDGPADNMFRVQADVVCCQTKLRNEAGWMSPTSFHAPMWRSTQSALARIPPPWFGVSYNENGTQRIADECEYFRSKALTAGLTIARGGWADHDSAGSWCG